MSAQCKARAIALGLSNVLLRNSNKGRQQWSKILYFFLPKKDEKCDEHKVSTTEISTIGLLGNITGCDQKFDHKFCGIQRPPAT